MYKFNNSHAAGLLLTLLLSGAGCVVAEEIGDADVAATVETVADTPASDAADAGADTADSDNDSDQSGGGIVIPEVRPRPVEAVPSVVVKSMQDDAEQALARGTTQTDTSDRTPALLIVLGLAGFAFWLGRNRNRAQPAAVAETVSDTTAEQIAAADTAVHEAAVAVVETAEEAVAVADADETTEIVDSSSEGEAPADAVGADAETAAVVATEEPEEDADTETADAEGNADETIEQPLDDATTAPVSAVADRQTQPGKGRPQKRNRGR
ncbi:MAG: hypothetical protein RLZZ226_653 [Pseudomonadota bacterium]|jgi:hypothetical protein